MDLKTCTKCGKDVPKLFYFGSEELCAECSEEYEQLCSVCKYHLTKCKCLDGVRRELLIMDSEKGLIFSHTIPNIIKEKEDIENYLSETLEFNLNSIHWMVVTAINNPTITRI